MKDQHLHIVSFNVPYPADYGGVIDVYYRLKALSENGFKIHLHCFQYGRDKSDVLDELCEKVSYYPRSRSLFYQLSTLPFIVQTRNSKKLLIELLKDNYPILFEGIHSCYYLNHPKLANRQKIVRSHNLEHDYYSGLSLKAKSAIERIYFSIEAKKLKRFEKVYKYASSILAISIADQKYLQQRYTNTLLVLPSHPSTKITSKEGTGSYILYHGDLSTQENTDAVIFILQKIAPLVNAEFIFAGKNPSGKLSEKVKEFENCKLIANPRHEEMQDLVSNAHINLLPTFQATGFKLKLLNALFNGRFCVGTSELVEGTNLNAYCEIADSVDDMVKIIHQKLNAPFTVDDIEKRKALMKTHSNSAIISKMIDLF